ASSTAREMNRCCKASRPQTSSRPMPSSNSMREELPGRDMSAVSSVRTPEEWFAFDSNRFSVGGGVPDSLKPGRAGPSQKSPDAAGSYKFALQGCSATRCPFLTGVNERFIERQKNRRDAK